MKTLYYFFKTLWGKIRFTFNYSVISDSEGKESFIVIGNASGRNPYCRTFLSQRDEPNVRTVWYNGGTDIAEKLGRKYGFVVISEISAPANLLDKVLHVPNFVALAIKLPADLQTYLIGISSTTRYNVKQLEKKGFTFEISTDPSWTACFFDQYYMPTMLIRHGDEAYIRSQEWLGEKLLEPDCEFVKIYRNGLCVAAGINQRRGEYYHSTTFGWYNGDSELRRNGVVSAFYWYTIVRAFNLGCGSVNFGGTPPYLENGVTHFKTRWGATLCKLHTNYGYRDLLLNPADPQCHNFLKNNSIIAYGIGNCFIVLSSKLPADCDLRGEFVEDIEAWYLLRAEQSSDWDEFSHRHLPVPLRGWYKYITLSPKNKAPVDKMIGYLE